MNQRATEYDLNNSQLEQLIDKYITTIVDSMSMEDFQQYVRNDMWDYLSNACLLYTSPSPRDRTRSRMPSSA